MKKATNIIPTPQVTPPVAPEPIESVEQAEKEMLALARLNAKLTGIIAETEKKVVDAFDSVSDEVAALEQQKSDLEERLRAFAKAKRNDETLFKGDSKTLKLMAGDISINAGKPSIQFLDGFDEKTVLIRIADQKLDGLTKTPDPELSKDAVMQQFTEGKLTPAVLTSLGLKKQQEESINVKTFSLDKLRKATEKKSSKKSKVEPKPETATA